MLEIIQRIETLIQDYQKDSNKRPGALVLGPKEYFGLCEFMKKADKKNADQRVGGIIVTEYRQIPIYLKEMPGIDIIIPHMDIWEYLR